MPRCILHPGRESVVTHNNQPYCAVCNTGILAAAGQVDVHVQPKACFVTFRNNVTGWEPITGTGCAHWVSHQLGLTHPGRGGHACLDGYLYRVPDIVRGRSQVPIAQARVGDIWANTGLDHTGLVATVTPSPHPAQPGLPAPPPIILIRHDSSRQGGVFTNDFATYFHGQGHFYR